MPIVDIQDADIPAVFYNMSISKPATLTLQFLQVKKQK